MQEGRKVQLTNATQIHTLEMRKMDRGQINTQVPLTVKKVSHKAESHLPHHHPPVTGIPPPPHVPTTGGNIPVDL